VIERELLAPLPSLRASIGRLVTRKVDRLSCVRFGSARYSVPIRLIGETVGLRTGDGRLLVIVDRQPARSSPSMSWSRRVRPRCSMTTTAGRGRRRGAGRPAENGRGEDVLRARAGRRSVHHRRRRGGHTGWDRSWPS